MGLLNRKIILFLALFAILGASVALAEFGTTRLYFNVPTDTSFQVAFPTTYVFEDINGTTEATASETSTWVSFNFSGASTQSFVQPSVFGSFARNQSGSLIPIMLIDATGNVNLTLALHFNTTLPTGIFVSWNSTCHPPPNNGCQGANNTPMLTNGNITQSSQIFVYDLDFTGSTYANLSLYGHKNASASFGETSRLLIYNSSNAAVTPES